MAAGPERSHGRLRDATTAGNDLRMCTYRGVTQLTRSQGPVQPLRALVCREP